MMLKRLLLRSDPGGDNCGLAMERATRRGQSTPGWVWRVGYNEDWRE